LRKPTISFAMSVCPPVCLLTSNNAAFDGRIIVMFDIRRFKKICRGNSSFAKIRQEKRVLYVKTFVFLW
jgi:hypothetical protein